MITGYNTDVSHSSVVFHVQTEDKGVEAASIESLVYVGGQILGKRQTGYRDLLDQGKGKKSVVELMDRQHRLMIAEIRGGQYDEKLVELGMVDPAELAPAAPAVGPPDSAEEPFAFPAASGEGPAASGDQIQTLDQIILEYLSSEAEQEHLVLMMDVDREFALGQPASLQFHTKASISGRPVPGTRISVKMISTKLEPMTLATGETDGRGELGLALDVPELERGSSALIVTATSEIGTAEIKHLL